MKNRNLPKLRFKGFNDEWKTYKSDELFINISDKNHNGDLNVLSVTQDRGVILRDELDIDIKFDRNSLKSYKKVKSGDYIISLRSFQGGLETSNQIGLISPAYTVFNFKKMGKYNNKFFGYIFKSDIFIKRIAGLIYGIRDGKAISFKDFSTLKLKVPSLEEQEKIVSFLTNVDKIIQKQEEKVSNLEKYKKGMMQKMFSKKIRIKKDDGKEYPEWQEKKLGDCIVKGKAGGTPKSTVSSYYGGKIKFLSISDMTSQGKYLTKTEKTITEEGLDNSSAWIVPSNSIIYSMYASVGFVSINLVEMATSQAMFSMIINEENDLNYIYYYLDYFRDNGISKFIETGTQGNLNAETVKNILIPYPVLEEQVKIADLFSKIDTVVNKEKEKLEELRAWKKGLLQQMFV